jgi:hypothetical protein
MHRLFIDPEAGDVSKMTWMLMDGLLLCNFSVTVVHKKITELLLNNIVRKL